MTDVGSLSYFHTLFKFIKKGSNFTIKNYGMNFDIFWIQLNFCTKCQVEFYFPFFNSFSIYTDLSLIQLRFFLKFPQLHDSWSFKISRKHRASHCNSSKFIITMTFFYFWAGLLTKKHFWFFISNLLLNTKIEIMIWTFSISLLDII